MHRTDDVAGIFTACSLASLGKDRAKKISWENTKRYFYGILAVKKDLIASAKLFETFFKNKVTRLAYQCNLIS